MAKILVVDDRPLNRELLRTLLQYQAHQISEAGDGRQALSMARSEQPDLIITDIKMPGMDGYEFVQHLRADQQLADSQIIFYTASYKTREAQKMAASCRVEHILFKPCEPEQILETVNLALKNLSLKSAPSSDENLSLLSSASFRLTALTEVCLDLSAERNPEALLEKFCHAARELVKAEFAALVVYEPELGYYTSRLDPESYQTPAPAAKWLVQSQELFGDQKFICLNSLNREAAQLGFPASFPPVRNLLGISLWSSSETYGWLYCINRTEAPEFDEQDRHLANSLTSQVGKSYENALLYARLQEQTQELQQQNQLLLETQHTLQNSQAELQSNNLVLASMVDQLQELVIQADSANQVKREFLNNMSHELRTPLHGVIAMSHLLLEDQLSQQQRSYLEVVSQSGKSLLGLIDNLFDFSRLTQHQLELSKQEFRLSEFAEQLQALISPRAQAQGLSFVLSVDPRLPQDCLGDPLRLKQILINLLGNAIKFTPSGEVQQRILLEADGLVRFEVQDTGIGISGKEFETIFSPFTQANGSLTRQYGGTGLGLTIANQLIERMGGRLLCKSEPDKGSLFSFTLELLKQAPEPEPAPHEPASGQVRTGHILLVEDNPINQAVAEAILKKQGYVTAIAPDGLEALKILSQAPFDLVLMDCQMPVMDGYEATENIRQGQQGILNPDIPIIALTAHTQEGDREKCLAAGMNDYLGKPFTHQELEAMLKKWLHQN